MSLIEAQVVAAEDQVLEAFDVSKGDHWADGINRDFEPDTFLKLMNPLLHSELDSTNLALELVRQGLGRGLRSNKWIGEGETICNATCLWFDSLGLLQKFLEKHPDERDRAGILQGVTRNSIEVDIYFVLVGCAQFINHFAGHRKTPNAMLKFNELMGFNRGSLTVVVNTRNKQGLPSGEIFLNYGLRFDLTVAYPKSSHFQERLKGPLTKFLKIAEVQASDVPSVGEQTTSTADDGGADPSPGGKDPQPRGGDAAAGEAAHEEEPDAKRLKTTDNSWQFKQPFSFVLQWDDGKVSLQNMEPDNKRLKKYFEFVFLADGEFKECHNFASLGANEIAFNLDAESLVSEPCGDWMPLSKFCKPRGRKEDRKNVDVFGIETTPKLCLAPQLWKFVSTDHKLLGFVKVALKVPGLFLGWRFKAEDTGMYKPTGCGIFWIRCLLCKLRKP